MPRIEPTEVMEQCNIAVQKLTENFNIKNNRTVLPEC